MRVSRYCVGSTAPVYETDHTGRRAICPWCKKSVHVTVAGVFRRHGYSKGIDVTVPEEVKYSIDRFMMTIDALKLKRERLTSKAMIAQIDDYLSRTEEHIKALKEEWPEYFEKEDN